MLTNAHIPILGFAAWSGTGKTTLLKCLLPILAARRIRVGMIKHAHHDFDVDTPPPARTATSCARPGRRRC